MAAVSEAMDRIEPIGDDKVQQIRSLNSNALIIRLHFTINHLSRWLTPIHDHRPLERSQFRGEPSIRDLIVMLREQERRVFPRMYLIATNDRADLDTLPPLTEDPARAQRDQTQPPVVLMSQFRRLRQSTCSLLRTLPDDAWQRRGSSRRDYSVTVRQLAEELAISDYRYLSTVDQTLDRIGVRDGLASIQKTHLDELLTLVPDQLTL